MKHSSLPNTEQNIVIVDPDEQLFVLAVEQLPVDDSDRK